MAMMIGINGTVLDPERAKVPVLDRGFLYGDSVYEVLRTYNGKPFAVQEHIDRLASSAARMEIELPEPHVLMDHVKTVLDAAGNSESYIRIIVTRGTGPITLDPYVAKNPLTVVIVKEFEEFDNEMFEHGISIMIPGVRRNPRSALDPAIKSGNYLNSILAMKEARKNGFDDALMLDMEGRVTEATTSNVFVVDARGRLCTPKLDTGILKGVTRGILIELAGGLGMDCIEKDLYAGDLESAREVMLTSTLREVMPVTSIDGKKVGDGKPGPVCRLLLDAFRKYALQRVGNSDA